MSAQPPLFYDDQDFTVDTSQDWMAANPNPLINLVQPFQVHDPLVYSGLLSSDARMFASSSINFHPFHSSVGLCDELERQGREVDILLHLENEKLKHKIQEQKKQQVLALLNSVEHSTLARMREAEQNLANVTSKGTELEECLERAEKEKEAWQKVTKQNEMLVMGLNNMLGQAQKRLYWATRNGGPIQDAESVCESVGGGGGEDKMICKGCRYRRSSNVFLPCRHLCACGQCESLLEICPVCESVKEGSIQVYLN